jgi:hypothetical protein
MQAESEAELFGIVPAVQTAYFLIPLDAAEIGQRSEESA